MGFFDFITNLFIEKDVAFHNSGMQHMAKSDFLKATYDFKEALKLKPTNEKYHDALGQSMYKRGMIQDADVSFVIADDLKKVAANQKDVQALCRLARAFQNKRLFSLSQGYIQRVLALDPKNDQVRCLKGKANQLGKKFKEAIVEYEKAIELNPYCVEAYQGLAEVYRIQGRRVKHVEYQKIAEQIAKTAKSTSNPDSHADLGNVFLKCKKTASAESEFKEALKLSDKCAKALTGMGVLKFEEGNYSESKDNFQKSIKLNKYDAHAHSYMGLIYKMDPNGKKKAEWELALAKQLSALEKSKGNPKEYQLYADLGDFLAKNNKLEDAEDAFLRSIRCNANYPEAYVQLAMVYTRQKKAEQAIGYCDHAIKLAPKKDVGYTGKGLVYMKCNDVDKAITQFQEALKLSPNNASTHGYLAELYKKKGMDKLAESELRVVESIKTTQEGAV